VPGHDPGPPRPPLTDAGRERLATLLREHYAHGQLDLDELRRRVEAVLSAQYADEAAAALDGLPALPATAGGTGSAGSQSGARVGQRRRHAQSVQPGEGWVPTAERFRDPSTRKIVRVWIDPADQSRHYIPDEETGT